MITNMICTECGRDYSEFPIELQVDIVEGGQCPEADCPSHDLYPDIDPESTYGYFPDYA